MTRWGAEYAARIFGLYGRPCSDLGCEGEAEVTGVLRTDGPFRVRILHNGVWSPVIVEDRYRESTALDELFREWINNEHDHACICDDGRPQWCPQHGDLWYDQNGDQYAVEKHGWPPAEVAS